MWTRPSDLLLTTEYRKSDRIFYCIVILKVKFDKWQDGTFKIVLQKTSDFHLANRLSLADLMKQAACGKAQKARTAG